MKFAMRTIAAALACASLALGAHGAAHAQTSEACKPEKLSALKMVEFDTAFAAANKRAHLWQPDAVVVRLAQTALGPIDPDARSANWYMVWFSPSTRKRIAITIANGVMTCYQDAESPGRVPVLNSGVYTDVRQLLVIASEKGGGRLIQNGAQPTVELSAASEVNGYRGLWYVNYRATDGRSLQVTFDGSTGKFEKAISN
jgi:hypothetical protein